MGNLQLLGSVSHGEVLMCEFLMVLLAWTAMREKRKKNMCGSGKVGVVLASQALRPSPSILVPTHTHSLAKHGFSIIKKKNTRGKAD